MLLFGPRPRTIMPPAGGLAIFELRVPEPPPPVAPEPAGSAAPPAPRAEPRPIPAPPPILPTPAPPAPPVAAAGPDVTAGASDRAGPGSGAGGDGIGRGSGGAGDGTGGGGIATRAEYLSGRIVDRDFPRAARRLRAEGTVVAAFTVTPDGRAAGCEIRQSSGNEALDETTCRLIEERFRFEPARDREGRRVADIAGWRQDWWLEGG
ncbi:protein TonB [Sphingomonas jejuensis]|uniref:Protein TonB n=1 Tax=Sphingomonas jejuensis TaxID=904715 RepID=A0ABX0XLV7_9SPHN|nr:energy transducer TonB [Sphingomonas jejuensis]NJC34219.1 protein TonB [Sphingomonas jejuensis]